MDAVLDIAWSTFVIGPSPGHRRPGYSRNPGPRLWRLAVGSGILIWVSACSGPSQLGSFFARNDDANDITHSISGGPLAGPLGDASLYLNGDLAAARAAAATMLEHDGQDSAPDSARWENPQTGARGTITTLASTYAQGGTECRDFLSSYVRDKAESWLQGEACRDGFGHWVVRELRPWNRS
jgi:surface antigen